MKTEKKLSFSKALNWFLTALVAGLFLVRIPQWWALYQEEGRTVAPFEVQSILKPQTLPIPSKKGIYVFWATWCGPCTIELKRLNEAVQKGELPAEAIHAISVGEDPELVFAEAKKRSYGFQVYADPSSRSLGSVKISGTPTLYHINEAGQTEYSTMGISPLLVFKAKNFLN